MQECGNAGIIEIKNLFFTRFIGFTLLQKEYGTITGPRDV